MTQIRKEMKARFKNFFNFDFDKLETVRRWYRNDCCRELLRKMTKYSVCFLKFSLFFTCPFESIFG